jgi:hypothetical protein
MKEVLRFPPNTLATIDALQNLASPCGRDVFGWLAPVITLIIAPDSRYLFHLDAGIFFAMFGTLLDPGST